VDAFGAPGTPTETEHLMSTQPPTRLASEDVIINAPLSYAGSAQRIFRIRRGQAGGLLVASTVVAIILVALSWLFITGWYLVWGLLLVPYRLLRRGSRNRKRQALQHREMLQAVSAASGPAIPELHAAPAAQILTASTDMVEQPGDAI
jgi:Flp pilus assembly protein TadB